MGDQRLAVVRSAIEHDINLFDVTIDEEKAAIGRNLATIAPLEDVYIQTRPAGMVYTYGNHNGGLTDYVRLRQEVERILELLQRDRIDLFNFGFEPRAIEHNANFFEAVSQNVERLQADGLIQFASADAQTAADYVKAIESEAFASISIGFHLATPEYLDEVLPVAKKRNVGVITRAVFMKGFLFEMAEEAGIDDLDSVAKASIRWCLDHDAVTSVLVGVAAPAELERNLGALEGEGLTEADNSIIEQLRATDIYQDQVA